MSAIVEAPLPVDHEWETVLEPPLTGGGGWRNRDLPRDEAVMHGPTFVRSAHERCGYGLTYWHRTRSATLHPICGPHRPVAYVSFASFCGVGLFSHRAHATDGLPDDGHPVCGACEGKAVGAGHPPRLVAPLGPLIFQPRRLTTPDVCPGSGTRGVPHDAEGRDIDCLICGDRVRLRYSSRGYGYGGSEEIATRHAPGPGLVLACEFHGWREMVRRDRDRAVVCRCEMEGDETHSGGRLW